MKNVLNALRMSVVFVILIFVSCGKNSGGAGGGGHVEPNPPVTETKPTISAVAPAKAWYGESAVGSVTATNATSVTASPGVVSGNIYTVNSVTGPTNVTLVAFDAKGNRADTTVVADVYTQKQTWLNSGSGQWSIKEAYVNGNSVVYCRKFIFNINGTVVVNPCSGPNSPPGPYSLLNSETQINVGGGSNPTYNLEIYPTIMIWTGTNQGQAVRYVLEKS